MKTTDPYASVSGSTRTPSKSGLYTDLSAYLSQNATGANALGDKIASGLESTGADVRNQLNTVSSDINKEITDNIVNYNEDTIKNAVADPTANYDAAYGLKTAEYKGPTSARSTGKLEDLDTAVGKAVEQSKLNDTLGGQQQLIKQNSTSGRYRGQGGLGLDNYLVQNTDSARSRVQGAADSLKPLETEYKSTQDQINENIAKAKETTANTAATASDALAKAVADYQTSISQRLANKKDTLGKQNTDLVNAMNSGQLSGEQLAALGITQDQWNSVQSANAKARELGQTGITDWSAYLSQVDPSSLTVNNVVSTDEANKYAALAKLAGLGAGYVDPNYVKAIGNAAINKTGINSALNTQISAGQKAALEAAAQKQAQEQAAAQQKAQADAIAAQQKAYQEQLAAQQAAYQAQVAAQQKALEELKAQLEAKTETKTEDTTSDTTETTTDEDTTVKTPETTGQTIAAKNDEITKLYQTMAEDPEKAFQDASALMMSAKTNEEFIAAQNAKFAASDKLRNLNQELDSKIRDNTQTSLNQAMDKQEAIDAARVSQDAKEMAMYDALVQQSVARQGYNGMRNLLPLLASGKANSTTTLSSLPTGTLISLLMKVL